MLSGQKTWVSNGGVADLYVVFAQTEPGSRSKGVTAFVLERGDAGLRFGPPMRKLGDRGIVNTELFLDDVLVPDDRRLGEEGAGFSGLMQTFDRSRVVLAAGCIGIARAAYEYAVAYARERVQFGRPIIEHQAVGFRLADAAMRIDAATSADLAGRPAHRRRRARDARGRDGQGLRLRGRDVRDLGRGADARRLRVLARVPGREVVPRCEARGDLGGHVRYPATDHRARPGAGRRVSEGRDLAPLFAPRSIAVAGASANPESWGYWLAQAAIEGADRRPVHLVNPRGGELFGRPLRASLRELDGEADLVVVAVPERALEDTVEAALEAGARSLVVITAGLGERDASGRARELALRDRVRAAGALMLGPNCIGIFDADANLRISSNEYPAGPVGLISQSGNLSLEVGLLLGRFGLGLSRFASVGNQADVTLPDLLLHLAEHDATRAIAVYVEDVADGRAFVEAARAATRRKPVVVLAAGTSEAGRRGAASHTGALVSDQAVLRAACEAAGALLVDSPGALADAVYALVRSPLPRGRRVAVIGDGGGHGAVCADLLTANGLEVPRLSERLVAQLDAALPPHGGIDNPVDLIGVGESELTAFSTAARVVLASGEIDAVAVTGYFGGYALYSHDYVRSEPAEAARLVELQESTGSPVVAHSMYAPDSSGAALRATGLAVFERTEQAVRALRALVTVAEERSAPAPLPLPARRVAALGCGRLRRGARAARGSGSTVPRWSRRPRCGRRGRDRGSPRPVSRPRSRPSIPALVHKSDRGGVRVGLPDAASLHAAALEMERVLAPERLFVERTAIVADGVELIVGARQDARFGPVVLVGLGGTLVEVLGDTALALAPLDPAAAAQAARIPARRTAAARRTRSCGSGSRRRRGRHLRPLARRRGAPRARRARGESAAGHPVRCVRARRARHPRAP